MLFKFYVLMFQCAKGWKKWGWLCRYDFFSGDSLCPLLASRRLLCRFRVEIVSAAGDNGCQMLEMWNRLMLYAPFHSPFHRLNSDSTSEILTRDGWIKKFIKQNWSSGLFGAVGAADKKTHPTAISMQLFGVIFSTLVDKNKI